MGDRGATEPFRIEREPDVLGPYRASRYTIAVGAGPRGPQDGSLVFNAMTGALLRFDAELASAYQEVVNEGELPDTPAGRQLLRLGIVIESEVRELEVLRALFAKYQLASKSPLLTIAPTIDCNFACDYCFETHEKGLMPEPVRAGVVRLVREALAVRNRGPLTVIWFGGEPLLGLPVILDLAARFDALVAEGVLPAWSSTLVTNGLMATPTTMARLAGVPLRSIQVTIDGPREIHDRRRALKSGKPSFDIICHNLARLPSGLATAIRVNVDAHNADALEMMMWQLAEAGVFARPEASVYLAMVENYAPLPDGRRHRLPVAREFLTTGEFAAVQRRFSAFCAANGWPVVFDKVRSNVSGVCQVDNENAYVVSPNGELIKCWSELGNGGEVVAHVLDPTSWHDPGVSALEDRDPFDDPDCNRCQLLPLCMGGCPMTRALQRQRGAKQCPPFKYTFEESLAAAYPELAAGDSVRAGDFQSKPYDEARRWP